MPGRPAVNPGSRAEHAYTCLQIPRQSFDQIYDLAACRRVLDPVKCRSKRPALGRGGKALEIFGAGIGIRTAIVDAFKEVADRNRKNGCDPIEPPCPDAVLPLLVFLDLLEGDTQTRGNLPLAETKRISAPAELAPDMSVDLVRRPHKKHPILTQPQGSMEMNTPLSANVVSDIRNRSQSILNASIRQNSDAVKQTQL